MANHMSVESFKEGAGKLQVKDVGRQVSGDCNRTVRNGQAIEIFSVRRNDAWVGSCKRIRSDRRDEAAICNAFGKALLEIVEGTA